MIPYWAALTVRDHDKVVELRDQLWEQLGEPSGYELADPHVTIHPGFSVPSSHSGQIAGILAHTVGTEMVLGPVQYWPSPEKPMVVKLSVEAPLSHFRGAIEEHINRADGTVDREPVPLHLTLFKSGDQGEEPAGLIDRPIKELGRASADFGTLETEISGFHMEARA